MDSIRVKERYWLMHLVDYVRNSRPRLSLQVRWKRGSIFVAVIVSIIVAAIFFYIYGPLEWTRTGAELVTYFGVILAIIGVFTKLYQDQTAARIELLKFLEEKFKYTRSKVEIAHAIQILENRSTMLYIDNKEIKVDQEEFIRTFMFSPSRHETCLVRLYMDTLLHDLRSYHHAVAASLVDIEDVKLYIRYYIELIFGGKSIAYNVSNEEEMIIKRYVVWNRSMEERLVWLNYVFGNDFHPLVDLCKMVDPELYREAIAYKDDWIHYQQKIHDIVYSHSNNNNK